MKTATRSRLKLFPLGLLLVVALIGALLFLPTQGAQASVVLKYSPTQLEQAAAQVVAAQVVKSEARAVHYAGSPNKIDWIETVVELKVLRGIKGFAGLPGETMTVVVPGGTVGDLTLYVDTAPVFRAGENVQLYLDKLSRVIGGRQGKQTLSPVEAALSGVAPGIAPSLAAGTGAISAITPSSGSAGTNTQVTITGTGFGTTKGTVNFFYRSGQPTIPAAVSYWSDTQIICTVPVGTVNGYSGSAGSGPVTVTNSGSSTPSAGYDFNVTFGYGGLKWPTTAVSLMVNPNTADTANEKGLIDAAAATWNGASSFKLTDVGTTTASAGVYDGLNVVSWQSQGSNGVLATTYYWGYSSSGTIIQCDIVFNDYYAWGDGSSATYDIQSIGLHELGHWLNLRDLYGTDSDKVMYGFGSPGGTKRALSPGDLAGIRWIYGGGTSTQFVLSTLVSGSGSITRSPNQTSYTAGSPVQLTAVPGQGYKFDHWSGDASGTSNPVSITMDANKSVTAVFTLASSSQVTLTTSVIGSGSITRNPNQTSYALGSTVQLTAVPAQGYVFTGWSGSATGTTNPVTITMDSNKSVTATFTLASSQFTLSTSAIGSGSITRNPNQTTYASGSTVQLTAVPSPGYVFNGWSGAITGTANPANLTMNSNKSVTATFTLASSSQATLTTSVIGSGSITRTPNQTTYAVGSTVQLTAVPAQGWVFAGWSGSATGTTNPLYLTMNTSKSITATFSQSTGSARYEDSDPNLRYQGSWLSNSHPSYSGGTYKYTNVAQSSVTAAFNGTGIKYIATKTNNAGYVYVSLDGAAPIKYNLYSGYTRYKQVIFTASGLSPGNHTLVITCPGQRSYGTGSYVNLDALDVTGTLIPVP